MKSAMPFAIASLTMLSLAASAAEDKGHARRTVKWSDVALPAGAVIQNKPGDSPALLVKHDGAKPLTLPLWKLDNPGITRKCYALRGKLRCKDVTGAGYLELWSVFPAEAAGKPESRYFSRSLAEEGPFRKITGTAGWRELFIPFDASQATQNPKALELNLILPGAGEVELTSLVLMEFDTPEAMLANLTTAQATPSRSQVLLKYVGLSAGAVTVAAAIWAISRRGRHAAEERRMRAMDAMP